MEWTLHGERVVYDSDWVRLALVDVELPDGHRFDHHVVRLPRQAAGAVIADPARGVLLLYRHRFITDTWGWEIPAGRIEAGEGAEDCAAREALEETGWRPGPLRPLVAYHPSNGLTDQRFSVFLADGATHVGEPVDAHEASEVRWLGVDEVRRELRSGGINDGMSVTGLAYALAFGLLG